MKYLHDNNDTTIVSYTTMNTIPSDLCDIKKKNTLTLPTVYRISKPMRKVTSYVSEKKDIPGIKKKVYFYEDQCFHI